MTTIAKVIRKAEKKAKHKADKKNRVQLVNEHNLVFDHQKVMELEQAKAFKLTTGNTWSSPFRGKSEAPEAPSLKEMFFLKESESTEPQQG